MNETVASATSTDGLCPLCINNLYVSVSDFVINATTSFAQPDVCQIDPRDSVDRPIKLLQQTVCITTKRCAVRTRQPWNSYPVILSPSTVISSFNEPLLQDRLSNGPGTTLSTECRPQVALKLSDKRQSRRHHQFSRHPYASISTRLMKSSQTSWEVFSYRCSSSHHPAHQYVPAS